MPRLAEGGSSGAGSAPISPVYNISLRDLFWLPIICFVYISPSRWPSASWDHSLGLVVGFLFPPTLATISSRLSRVSCRTGWPWPANLSGPQWQLRSGINHKFNNHFYMHSYHIPAVIKSGKNKKLKRQESLANAVRNALEESFNDFF